jgi:mono/diheme cytochrome c family protein
MKVPTALLALAVTATVSVPPSGAQVSQQSPQDAAVMERGRYLVETAAFCGVCHTTRGADGRLLPGMELAGGRIFYERGFHAVVPNITPDPETGIGRWSDVEIAAAVRDGRRPDGRLIGPPMPIELYRGLSDHDTETYAPALERFAFLQWFRGILVSGEVKVIKPDRRIFELLIERFGIDPHSAVYIDDVEANVAAARPFGIHAIHFKTPAALREELVELGLLATRIA